MDESKVEYYFTLLMKEGLGFDLSDPNLSNTPARVAKMYCREFFCNFDKEFDDFKSFPNTYGYNEIILSDRIYSVSMCSHHFLPFYGHAWVSYLPQDKLIGASKMSRMVNHYACRPQLQEHLCHQILQCMVEGLKPRGAMVVIRAVHGCMTCRGVRQTNGAGMITSAIQGEFLKDADLKMEGMDLIKLSMKDL